jgi:hypothetical protein
MPALYNLALALAGDDAGRECTCISTGLGDQQRHERKEVV